MSKTIKIKRGKDIVLVGQANNEILSVTSSSTYAIKPHDFKGLVPKLNVKEGDEVKAGDCLFYDKKNPEICFTSPVSGEVAEIVRGDRRAIMEVRVLADKETNYKEFNVGGFENKSADEIKSILLESGLWPTLVQRPFGLIAKTDAEPKAIHISGFDSAPLGVDFNFSLQGEENNLQTGIRVLSKLCSGIIHLNVHKKKDHEIYKGLTGVQMNFFEGPHPSGLPGVQIHHIDPIAKGDVVWTINPQHLAFIGRLFNGGKLDLKQVISVAGSELVKPAYYSCIAGCSLETILKDNLKQDNVRVISGDVLTGTRIEKSGYLGYFDQLISVIPEGDEYEFLGWLVPSYPRPTISNSLPISKFLTKKFKVNTNLHGEERAFVVTGQYEQVLPMDILPVQLLKSILAGDLDKMEQLGIYEVIEEDMALCEFVCTSKIEVQQILSEGLELMAEEG
ncbi:Na(+)-translocating NADH-quinone reductase subunit A [bacterium]|nr:Na(+)-translocating NADH-quinone reductase subunit A [bacterium]